MKKKPIDGRDLAVYYRSYEPIVADLVDHLEWSAGKCFHTFDLQELFTKKMLRILKQGDKRKQNLTLVNKSRQEK